MTAQRRDIETIQTALDELDRCRQLAEGLLPSIAGALDGVQRYLGGLRTAFELWLRQNPRLDARQAGLSIHNLDWVIHQFKVAEDNNGPRTVNNVMLIEEKRYGKTCSFAQRDTLLILDQLLTASGVRDSRASPRKVTTQRGDTISVRYFGLHVLTFSHSGPLDSSSVLWDGQPISLHQLEGLLRYELHPRTLRLRDDRRHHANDSRDTPLLTWRRDEEEAR